MNTTHDTNGPALVDSPVFRGIVTGIVVAVPLWVILIVLASRL